GEIKPNEILQAMLNDTYNMTFNNHNMMNQGITYYDKDVVGNANQLVRSVGNKIPIGGLQGRAISNVILESFGQSLPRDHYAIPETIERFMDMTSRQFAPGRGEPTGGDQTATEASLLKETGDESHELSIRQGEYFLSDVGRIGLAHIAQFGTLQDTIEVVGLERAVNVVNWSNPTDLPGGFNFSHRASENVANQLVKQRNWKEMYALLSDSPNVLRGELDTELMTVFNTEQDKIERIIIPDEVMQQREEQQAMLTHEKGVQLEQVKGQNSLNVANANNQARFKENNPVQEAQKAGREQIKV
ncbi:MAG: hypothetical protein KAV87_06915, partial [Desulfobacteraceae bacterium]|nr:hypothetical protein [Desulfobacteraceae bacterium]